MSTWRGRSDCPATLQRTPHDLDVPRRPFAHAGSHDCMFYSGHPGPHKCRCNTRWIAEGVGDGGT